MNPFQRVTRPGLGELDALAGGIASLSVGDVGCDPEHVREIAEEHRQDLPERLRSALGIFYTPPAVAERLLDDLASVGARFDGTMSFCDPACGGGAFLLPVARRVAERLSLAGGSVSDLARCLIGIDIDPGGLSITRAALDAVARKWFGVTAEWDLRLANSLRLAVEGALPTVDVVVGNPPFGRVRLASEERAFFGRSLKGHANLYGLFVDVALQISRGRVGYVMPTSWLCGDYFSTLRSLLSVERPLLSLRFVESRSHVFIGVLQEMCLAVFGSASGAQPSTVYGELDSQQHWGATVGGPSPWLIARTPANAELLAAAVKSRYRLSDYGFAVHTGPLVWNRHRSQLRASEVAGTSPIIWSDAVRAGEPVAYRSSKRPQQYLSVSGMHHLLLEQPAVLVKRTTAKEQARRVVAAPFDSPPAVVENHLNVVVSQGDYSSATVEDLSALLNSGPVDCIFRSISGSVAVSATELAALPLPAPDALVGLSRARDFDSVVLDAYSRGANCT